MTTASNNFLSRSLTTLLLALILCAAVILGIHALQQHGSDAQAVRRCAENPGPFQVWLERDGCARHNLVKLEDGRTGDQITMVGEDNKTYELTSFIPKKGILSKIEDWLMSKNAVRILPK